MAVVLASITATGQINENWSVPPGEILDQTYVPRGLLVHQGTTPILAKGVGDGTRVRATLTFNDSFCYILRDLSLQVGSDDDVLDFDSVGQLSYAIGGIDPVIPLVSPGIAHIGATLASVRTYVPDTNYPRILFGGGTVGDATLQVADVSADASTAGDASIYASWFVYDLEQCLSWPINSPQPSISI